MANTGDGKLVNGIIEFAGANTPGWISNLGMTYAAGVLTITDAQGAALSPSNPGFVTVPSTTAGQYVTLKVTAPASFNDDAHASSDLTNLGFGLTESVAWANDRPFFIGVVNRANSDLDGVDGSSAFGLTLSPFMSTTPSSANDIGDTGAIPTNDSQNVLLIIDDVTVANYTSLPYQIVASLRMTWSTVTDDYTVSALGNKDGFGKTQLDKTFATVWTMPVGQNGSEAGKYFTTTDGATALVFAPTNEVTYLVYRNGECQTNYYFNNLSVAGADGTVVRWVLPYAAITGQTNPGFGSGRCDVGTLAQVCMIYAQSGLSYAIVLHNSVGSVADDDFTDTNDQFFGHVTYKAFS